jgi:hypothetical protein
VATDSVAQSDQRQDVKPPRHVRRTCTQCGKSKILHSGFYLLRGGEGKPQHTNICCRCLNRTPARESPPTVGGQARMSISEDDEVKARAYDLFCQLMSGARSMLAERWEHAYDYRRGPEPKWDDPVAKAIEQRRLECREMLREWRQVERRRKRRGRWTVEQYRDVQPGFASRCPTLGG